LSQDSPLGPGYTGRSDEDSAGTHELTDNLNVQTDNVDDSPRREGYTSRSDEASMKLLKTLMVKCTNLELKCDTLEGKVLDLQTLSAAQAK
jgi:hypothetical protein